VGELFKKSSSVGGGSRSGAHDTGHFGRNLVVDKTKAKQVLNVHSNPLLSCSSYVLTSVYEEGFVLSWNWVLLGQTEMQE
jgi:hypothetical protein